MFLFLHHGQKRCFLNPNLIESNDLEFDIRGHSCVSVAILEVCPSHGSLLVRLHQLLVVGLHDLESHNLLSQLVQLFFLLLFLCLFSDTELLNGIEIYPLIE